MKTLQYRTWHRSIQSFQNTIRMVRLLRLIQWLLQSYLPFIQFMIFYHAFRCMSSERVANSDCFQFFPVSSSITFVTDRGPPKTDMPYSVFKTCKTDRGPPAFGDGIPFVILWSFFHKNIEVARDFSVGIASRFVIWIHQTIRVSLCFDHECMRVHRLYIDRR